MRIVITAALLLAAAPGAALAQTKAADPDKQICKSHVITGEAAKRLRECHTAAEWQRMAEDGRNEANHYRDVLNSSRGGG